MRKWIKRLKTYEEDTKLFDASQDNKQKCTKCGHTIFFFPDNDTQICSHCKAKNKNKTIAHFRFKFYTTRNGMKKDEKENI